jgi:hypothetical protein
MCRSYSTRPSVRPSVCQNVSRRDGPDETLMFAVTRMGSSPSLYFPRNEDTLFDSNHGNGTPDNIAMYYSECKLVSCVVSGTEPPAILLQYTDFPLEAGNLCCGAGTQRRIPSEGRNPPKEQEQFSKLQCSAFLCAGVLSVCRCAWFESWPGRDTSDLGHSRSLQANTLTAFRSGRRACRPVSHPQI